MEGYLGTIMLIAFNWAPQSYALCNGALLPISQMTALFALLGTNFGGDGRSTFGLPDLRGRVPVGMGDGPQTIDRPFASVFGADETVLTTNNLPAHQHSITEKTPGQTVTVNANAGQANKLPATGHYWARGYTGTGATQNYADSHDTTMASDAVQLSFANLITGPAGGGLPFEGNPPSLTLNYSICTNGLFPSRP